MCWQDLAISRAATINITRQSAAGTALRLPANPDRIALHAYAANAGVVRVYLDPADVAVSRVYASNVINHIIGGSLAGSLDTYVVAETDFELTANVKINAADDPGIISGALYFTGNGIDTVTVVETILDQATSKIIQELD